jgi:regulator of replication initiation timing
VENFNVDQLASSASMLAMNTTTMISQLCQIVKALDDENKRLKLELKQLKETK